MIVKIFFSSSTYCGFVLIVCYVSTPGVIFVYAQHILNSAAYGDHVWPAGRVSSLPVSSNMHTQSKSECLILHPCPDYARTHV
jgi:hypothetical protein